jgi:UDP-N-acetylglucosamine diphosphorylase/glucosamine-1-phosphate N-acetyltransferase
MLAAVILAAGLGKRMRSALPKVLHEANGQPLIGWVAGAARGAGAERLIAVVGPEMTDEQKRAHLAGFEIVIQRDRLGTGHAAMQALPHLDEAVDEALVLCGDVPCIRAETLRELVETRRREDAAASVLTMVLDDPGAYGRIVRENDGVAAIVEQKDASEAIRAIREVNSGTYAFRRDDLLDGLKGLSNRNAQGEYYITDVIRHCVTKGERVSGVIANPDELVGVNTPDELAVVSRILAARLS